MLIWSKPTDTNAATQAECHCGARLNAPTVDQQADIEDTHFRATRMKRVREMGNRSGAPGGGIPACGRPEEGQAMIAHPSERTPAQSAEAARLLLILAKRLDEVRPYLFDFGIVCSSDYEIDPNANSCGAPACAMGHAAFIPEFQAKGICFAPFAFGGGEVCYRTTAITNYHAMSVVLCVTLHESQALFAPSYYHDGITTPNADATAREVADHIRRFVAKHLEGG